MTTGAGVGPRPVLYSFRRCPYAIRARMALARAGIAVELREVLLRDKPPQLLAISPKGTVPVLQTPDGAVIDESLAIMHWALRQSDPDDWLGGDAATAAALVQANDATFKPWLDRYKYSQRHPESPPVLARAQAEAVLAGWERRLQHSGGGLVDAQPRLPDVALFPFVRQFAGVDPQWWAQAPYPRLRRWLAEWTDSGLFEAAMRKFHRWTGESQPQLFDGR